MEFYVEVILNNINFPKFMWPLENYYIHLLTCIVPFYSSTDS